MRKLFRAATNFSRIPKIISPTWFELYSREYMQFAFTSEEYLRNKAPLEVLKSSVGCRLSISVTRGEFFLMMKSFKYIITFLLQNCGV
jgi:hypothetical protein